MLKEKVTNINIGAVNAEVDIELPKGQKVTFIITINSVNRLGLETGTPCFVLIKASSVMVAVD